MKTMKKDLLTVNIYETRDEMGKAAGADIKAKILELLAKKGFYYNLYNSQFENSEENSHEKN